MGRRREDTRTRDMSPNDTACLARRYRAAAYDNIRKRSVRGYPAASNMVSDMRRVVAWRQPRRRRGERNATVVAERQPRSPPARAMARGHCPASMLHESFSGAQAASSMRERSAEVRGACTSAGSATRTAPHAALARHTFMAVPTPGR